MGTGQIALGISWEAEKQLLAWLHAVSTYKGHFIRDTFWKLVKFLGKIRDRLVLGNKFTVAIEIFTMKLPYNEAKFWDKTIQNSGNFLGQTSLKSTLSLISGNWVYLEPFFEDVQFLLKYISAVHLWDPWRLTGRFNVFTTGGEESGVDLAVGRRLLGRGHGGRGGQRGPIEVSRRRREMNDVKNKREKHNNRENGNF